VCVANSSRALFFTHTHTHSEKNPNNKQLHLFLGVAGRDGWLLRSTHGFCAYVSLLSSLGSGDENNAYYAFMFTKSGLFVVFAAVVVVCLFVVFALFVFFSKCLL
jgi:hypothetical protein